MIPGFYLDFLLKILQLQILRPPYWNLNDDGHAWIVPSHCPDIFRKSNQMISVYYMWFRNGSEKIGLRGNFTPPPGYVVRVNAVCFANSLGYIDVEVRRSQQRHTKFVIFFCTFIMSNAFGNEAPRATKQTKNNNLKWR